MNSIRIDLNRGTTPDINANPSPEATTVDRRHRGDHSTACKNRDPRYNVPDAHENRGRPAFIREIVAKIQSMDVTKTDHAMFSRAQGERQKQFYEDRARAICALFAVFAEHVNLITWDVDISLRNASDAAGLTTWSDAELAKAKDVPSYTAKPSTSRASRAFHDMRLLGAVKAPDDWQVWDKARGYWLDKQFDLTPVFFNMIGITTERLLKKQQQQFGYAKKSALNAGRPIDEVGRMSISQLRLERRQHLRQKAFDYRAKTQAAKKAQRNLNGKTRLEQREVATKNVITMLQDDIGRVDHDTFVAMVNREIGRLRNLPGVDPPTQH